MPTTELTVTSILDRVATLMNDTAKTQYTHVATIPYLNIAFDELQEHFELHNIPDTNQSSVPITVNVGTTVINPIFDQPPNYPSDLVEIQQLWERLSGSTDPFIRMTQREYLDHTLDDLPSESLIWWTWQDHRIKFIGALTNRQVKIDYIKTLFPNDLTINDSIDVINAKSFLSYRTAGLCSQFIGENVTRAKELNEFAGMALDRVTGIGVKSKQSINTRRRPFMAAYRSRQGF